MFVGKCLFDSLKRVLALSCPVEDSWSSRLLLSFECVEKVEKVTGGAGDEPSVVIDHAKEPLEFLDRGRRLLLSNRFDAFREEVRVTLELVELGAAEGGPPAVLDKPAKKKMVSI